jgi:large subunit ribosomal protein L31
MKATIHPEYVESTVHCACGSTFTTRSTKANLRVDICAKCHPFFTGDQRLVDTGGQVERFMRRVSKGRGPAATLPDGSSPTTESTSPN